MQGFTYKYGDRPLEGYTIQRAAGRGGFGEVYYALSDSGREVALKVVQGYEAIELRGISQCMNLKSPHLVTIFDVKYNEAGRPFVIMEYVAGPSLRQLLDESPAGLGTQKTAFFLREMAKGLTYLHDRGIVHRDLKPGNVFYEDGYVKIGDYGLSKAMSASRHSGQTITVGTVHYMAPEIGQGTYDRSIDIYALGCMTYELLTGQTPYLGSSPGEILMKHMVEEPDLANIQEPFATVIRKALAKEPKDRFQTVQEMVEAVFGAAHIQQSVSCFSPENLTMVAGRVAKKVAAGGPGSSGPMPGTGGAAGEQGEWIDRFGQRMERVEQRIEMAGDRISERVGQVADRVRQKWQGKGQEAATPPASVPQAMPAAPMVADPARDPLNGTQRRLMALAAIVILGCGATILSSTGANDDVIVGNAMMAGFLTLGALIGLSVVCRKLMHPLMGESGFVQRFAVGGVSSTMALLFSIPAVAVWLDHGPIAAELQRQGIGTGGTVMAALAPLFLLNWLKVMRSDRRQRISLRHALLAALLAGGLAAAMSGSVTLAAGVAAGISLAMQVACPFDPLAGRAGGSSHKVKVAAGVKFGVGGAQDKGPDGNEQRGQGQERAEAWQQRHEGRRHAHAGPLPNGVWTSNGCRPLPPGVSPSKRAVALALTAGWLMGLNGLQRFYVGKIWTGLLWLCTFGLFGIGQLIDAIMIISGNFRDKHGRRLVVWANYNEVGPGVPAGWQGPAGQLAGSPIAGAPEAVQAELSTPPAVRAGEMPGSGVQQSTVPRESLSRPAWNIASPVLGFLGGLLLLVTLVLAVIAGLAVPVLIAVAARKPSLASEPMFDILTDYSLFGMVSSLAMVLAGMLVLGIAVLLLVARRRAGGAHIMRGILGCGAALLSIYAFWAAMIPGVYRLGPAVAEMRQQHVQETIKALSRAMEPGFLVFAGALLLLSVTVLAWPAQRREPTPVVGRGV